ncbi:MAG TPA: carboxypeptidase regulatory-like domain-containing protein [Burkholderiales bacterium]|nr:carboxypeptidase regulatory-like domain-containing protein [Burkholderiales bacterium]
MRNLLIALALAAFTPAQAADVLLSGSIRASSGEPMGGVTVSAKPQGGTITTSVFTDESGNYTFTPLPAGKYRVWAQALGYRVAKSEVDLSANRRQNFSLSHLTDPEQAFKQLPGNLMLAALPGENEHDKRMKRMVRNDCTGCHTASFPLQHRFDEAGWSAVIELMKNANVYGAYVGKDRKPAGLLDFHQKELAAYLARARGPGKSAMNVKPEPRPSGEAARVVFREYDLPLDPDVGLPANFIQNDGTDWTLGTPSVMIPGWGVHDSWLDTAGNLWFTCNIPNKRTTLGRIDTRTGEVKLFMMPGANGRAAQAHGMTRDPNGIIWFNVNTGRGSLGRLDPKTENISVYVPPEGMSPTGGATTVDYDGKGRIWVSSPDGALRFDPDTEKFTEYKSVTYKTANGTGTTYGAAADRDGNGYWAEMTLDIIGVGDGATGKSSEIKLAPVKEEMDRVTPEARKFYETYNQPDFNVPLPWAQGPRRMGTDKNADVLWVGNSWGANLARVDTRTRETTYVPLPGAQQPYHVAVDSQHRAWTNLWGADRVARYDPTSATWTTFDLPTRGAEPRYISLNERDGQMQVVLPYFRARKVAVMTVRSEAEMRELKERVAR